MDIKQWSGQSEAHLEEVFPGYFLHCEAIAPYLALVNAAEASGVDLRLSSGYRSFDQQLAIWNTKASGKRSVLTDSGEVIDLAELADIDKVHAILRWSALPGASRHHWGTDVDVWDAASLDKGYRPQLISEEYQPGGVFFRLNQWLDGIIASGSCEFYRPYDIDRGGVAPEPWHLSCRAVAETFECMIDAPALRHVLENADILFKSVILDNFDNIYQRYVGHGV